MLDKKDYLFKWNIKDVVQVIVGILTPFTSMYPSGAISNSLQR